MSDHKSNPPKTFEVDIGTSFRLTFEFEEQDGVPKNDSESDDTLRYKLKEITIGKLTMSYLFVVSSYWALKATGIIEKLIDYFK